MSKIPLNSPRSLRARYYLVNDGRGMGGDGNPPDHYLNQWVVTNGVDGRGPNGYEGYTAMSVDYAAGSEGRLPNEARNRLVKLMSRFGWN